jgi:hypothetical protein
MWLVEISQLKNILINAKYTSDPTEIIKNLL